MKRVAGRGKKGLLGGEKKGGCSADGSRCFLQVMTIKGPVQGLFASDGGHFDAQVMV